MKMVGRLWIKLWHNKTIADMKNPSVIIFFLPCISPNLPKKNDEKKSIPLYSVRISEIKKRLSVYSRAINGMKTEAVIQAAE
jgi:hypothetical protein